VGDRADLEAIYRDHSAALWRSVFAYTAGRREVADDVVAEAFARALASGGQIRYPVPWLFRVAFRLAAAEMKQDGKRGELAEVPVTAASPGTEGLTEVLQELRRLSPAQRAAVYLHYQADLPVARVAALLGMSQASVRVTSSVDGGAFESCSRRTEMRDGGRKGLGLLETVQPSPGIWERAVARSGGPEVSPGKDVGPELRHRVAVVLVAGLVAGAGLLGVFLAFRCKPVATPGGGEVLTYTDPQGTWSIDYPSRFIRGPISVREALASTEGIWIANFPSPILDGVPCCLVRSANFPDDGVMVTISQFFGGPGGVAEEPDSGFPVSLDALRYGKDAWRYGGILVNGDSYLISVRVGPGASEADRTALSEVVSSLRFLPLRVGSTVGRHGYFFVLGPPETYPVGSVTRFDRPQFQASGYHDVPPFHLVHVPEGFYALAWRGDLEGGYKACDVTFDSAAREFACPNGARWAQEGSVIARPTASAPDDPLDVLLVRISFDGHVLVSPSVSMRDTQVDLELTGSGR
jgi:RNA polymerase sigma-70 factor (ECF subfamily)